MQGFEGFFYGAGSSGVWKNHGASNRDLAFYGWSLPFEGNGSYTKHIAVSSFSSTTYLYAEGFPTGFELSQIVLRFDSELPDTSTAEDEIQKNVFRLRTNDDTVWEEYSLCGVADWSRVIGSFFDTLPSCMELHTDDRIISRQSNWVFDEHVASEFEFFMCG